MSVTPHDHARDGRRHRRRRLGRAPAAARHGAARRRGADRRPPAAGPAARRSARGERRAWPVAAAARRPRPARPRTPGAGSAYWPAATRCSTASGRAAGRGARAPGRRCASSRIPPPSPTPAPGSAGRVEDTEVVTLVGRPAGPAGSRRCTTAAGCWCSPPGAGDPRRGRRPAARARLRPEPDAGTGTARRASGNGRVEGTADDWAAAARRPPERHRRRLPPRRPARRPGSAPYRACPTPRTSTTASSPSATSAPPPSARWRPPPVNSCGTSAAAPARSPSSGCARTARCRAVAVERDPVRAERIARNADALGVPGLRVVTGAAPAALAGLPVAGRGVHRRRADRPRPAGRVLGGAARRAAGSSPTP